MLKSSPTLAPLSSLHGRRRTARAVRTAFTTASFAGSLLLSGCGAGRMLPDVNPNTSATVHGNIHGGQQPVSGARIQLWAAGAAGNQSAATPLLTTAVYSDGGGGFGITGDYTCPSATTQVYLTATGGNPGLGGSVNNASLALMAVLGDCGSLATVPMISVNELTTVAAAYGLAPFASGVGQVGASASNLAGLRSAMQTSMMLASPYSGAAPAPVLPANAVTETAKLITLANVIANCVNSDGGTACTALQSDASVAGYPTPQDTFQVALTVAQHPGSNVAALFNDAPAHAAFGGALASAPHDWTMSIAYTGGGLARPNKVSVDAAGRVWVSNFLAGVSGFSPQGAPLFPAGVTGGMGKTGAATVDANGNIWVANGAYDAQHPQGSVALIAGDGTVLSGAAGYTTGGINLPDFIAPMPNGAVLVANAGSSQVLAMTASGVVLTQNAGYGAGVLSGPSAIALDAAGNAWVANRTSGALVKLDPSGNVLLQSACCSTPDSLAIDSNSNLWVGDSTAGTVTEVRSDGVVLQVVGSNSSAMQALTIDGGSHLFALDSLNAGIVEIYDSSYAAAGTVVGQTGLLGKDVNLRSPSGIAADASGNVWVTSSRNSKLVNFVGLAVPVQTPRMGLPMQP